MVQPVRRGWEGLVELQRRLAGAAVRTLMALEEAKDGSGKRGESWTMIAVRLCYLIGWD